MSSRGKAIAGLLGLLCGLLAAELGARALRLAPPPPDPMDPFEQFHRRDPDPAILYTLRPGAQGQFQNAQVRVNAQGCRDDAVTDSPQRVLALGDSITFGASIDQDVSWEARLDRALGPEVDVLNCGVSGYNLLQALARYDRDLADLRPDIVLLNLFSDDLAPPYRLDEPGLRRGLRARSAAFRAAELGWLGATATSGRALPSWADDETAYRLEAERRAAAWVSARQREGIRVLLVLHPMLMPVTRNWQATHSEVRAFAEAVPAPLLALEPLYADATGGQLQQLSINPESGDPHPNLAGQELLALAIWRSLYAEGWVETPPADAAPPR